MEYDIAAQCLFQCLFKGGLDTKMFKKVSCRCKDGKILWRDDK